MADNELRRDPLHLTIVGDKNDDTGEQLFAAGFAYPGWYKRIEWWDRDIGPVPNADVQYPDLDRTTAFVCTNNRLRVFEPDQFTEIIRRISSGGP